MQVIELSTHTLLNYPVEDNAHVFGTNTGDILVINGIPPTAVIKIRPHSPFLIKGLFPQTVYAKTHDGVEHSLVITPRERLIYPNITLWLGFCHLTGQWFKFEA